MDVSAVKKTVVESNEDSKFSAKNVFSAVSVSVVRSGIGAAMFSVNSSAFAVSKPSIAAGYAFVRGMTGCGMEAVCGSKEPAYNSCWDIASLFGQTVLTYAAGHFAGSSFTRAFYERDFSVVESLKLDGICMAEVFALMLTVGCVYGAYVGFSKPLTKQE